MLFSREPALIIAVIASTLQALVLFGVSITEGQVQAVLTVATALLTLAAGGAIRQVVYSPKSYTNDVDAHTVLNDENRRADWGI